MARTTTATQVENGAPWAITERHLKSTREYQHLDETFTRMADALAVCETLQARRGYEFRVRSIPRNGAILHRVDTRKGAPYLA